MDRPLLLRARLLSYSTGSSPDSPSLIVRQGKPVVVYVAPARDFYTLRQSEQLAEMVRRFDPAAIDRIDRELQSLAIAAAPGHKGDGVSLF